MIDIKYGSQSLALPESSTDKVIKLETAKKYLTDNLYIDVPAGSVTYPSLENQIVLSQNGDFDEETGIASYAFMATAYGVEPTVTPGYVDSAPNLGFERTGTGTIQIPTTYVGPDVERKDANDLTLAYNSSTSPTSLIITAPAGYYESDAQRSLSVLRATTYYPKTTDQSIAYGKYLAGTQTIKAVTLTNLTAENIKSGVTVKVGDSSDDDRIASITGTAPGWTLLGSKEHSVSTTSTSAGSATTISIGSAAWTDSKIIYVRIRDKAGKRAGYFYGSDTFFINLSAANGATADSNHAVKFIHRYSESSAWGQYTCTGTSGYGVYPYNLATTGLINIYRRYNSTYSLTINGTYVIEVYALDYPDGISPYDA